MAFDTVFSTVGRVSRLVNVAKGVKESIDSRDPEKLKTTLTRLGVPEDEARSFSELIVSLSNANKDEIKDKVINWIHETASRKGVTVKREEIEDAVEGIMTIVDAVLKSYTK